MGSSTSWGLAPFLCCVLAAQAPLAGDAALRAPKLPTPEVALASLGEKGMRIAEFGLGDGGIPPGADGALRWLEDGCVTTGGVHVACRSLGVKLTFPSGRELLVAPDGFVHLRSGESAGPFATGLELLLADGQSVRIALAPNSTQRVRDVVVGDRARRLQPWRHGAPAGEVPRDAAWGGLRFVCCGDGGDVYRAIALGPLLVLDRVLVAADRAEQAPPERLVVFATPLVQSLRTMQRQHREPEAAVRAAMTAVAAVADRADAIFPVGAALARAERDRLRWLLRGGFELELDTLGQLGQRLQLFAGDSPVPMVEWTLRADSAAFLTNPRDGQPDKRWHGNGTRLPKLVPELQAREELRERTHALQVIGRLKH